MNKQEIDNYFIISNSDGNTHVDMISKEELLKRIKDDNYYGKIGFFEQFPTEPDTNYWDDLLIIKGKVVVPKPKEKIIEYEVE